MPLLAVVGAQWGDEGKGKIIDMLSEKADLVVRYAGGPNAGHTVSNSYGLFKLHLIPSGVFYPHTLCLIGSAVVISPPVFLDELDQLKKKNIDTSRICISSRAHLIMPYHILLDRLEEEAKGSKAIGTTHSGVGPAYMDKIARIGVRVGDLLNQEELLQRLRPVVEQKNTILTRIYGQPPLSLEEIYQKYCQYAEQLAPFICEVESVVNDAMEKKKLILLEGAQGTLLDIDFGTYPYVTSSAPIAGGAFIGTGIPPSKIDYILGIFKAYTTRVGGGPMPTELKDKTGERIRDIGHEYGATTGRPRRCGWFDAVATRFSASINGLTGAALTRLDILDSFESVKICTGYKVKDKVIDRFPSSTSVLENCQPVYEELPGWKAPTTDIRRFKDLPRNAQGYVKRIERLTGCPVDIISVGPKREQTIHVKPLL